MQRQLRLGIIGLGRAFTLMLPTFLADERVLLVAAYDPRAEALQRFASDFDARVYTSPEQLCDDPCVEVVYIASPHQFHVEHVQLAAGAGKHIMVEKPMALGLADCQAMISAAGAAGVHLIVGHSHSFDAPYLRARELIMSGRYGAPKLITAINYTDFLYRPRRPEELDTAKGGGVVFSQGAHQVDVVRLFTDCPATSLMATTGQWDPSRPTEGAFCAQISFGSNLSASLTYSGYGRFDTDEFNGWAGELGQSNGEPEYGRARRILREASSVEEEMELKNRRAYGPSGREAFQASKEPGHNHFGFVLVTCEKADLRPTPAGVMVYADEGKRLDWLPPPTVPRREVVDELYAALVEGTKPLHSGEWGLATMEICLGILASAKERGPIALHHQR